jgi:tetratricopeptide (TPR) repeat protein
MKTVFSFVSILFITNGIAQKFECESKTLTYQELYKAKKIVESFEIWSEVKKNCPKESEIIYNDGFPILQFKIDNAGSEEEKIAFVRDKMKLYDQYNKNFPFTTADFEVNKAMILYDNKIDAKDEIFNLLNSGFSNASKSVTNANAIYLYFSLCYEKHKQGNKDFPSDLVIEKYMLVNLMLTQLQVTNSQKFQEYKTAQQGINALAKDIATCDNLATYYEKNFPSNNDNTDWISTGLNCLSGKCSANPIFATMAEKLYSIKVTPQSAYYMALSSTKQKKFTEAIQFYNESAQLDPNPLEKANLYYTLASGLVSVDKSKSKEYLNKALTFDPKMGKAYLFLAQIYSSSAEECGKTDFEKKAIFFLAIQTVNKASYVDSNLKATADKMAEYYVPKSLNQDDIKKAKMNGKSLYIGCWINENITFPSK